MDTINRALKPVARFFLAVQDLNDPVLQKWRFDTCKACPKFDPDNVWCTVCGCFMDVKTGLFTNKNPEALGRIEITHCPEGRWNDRHIANMYREVDGKERLVPNG